MDIYCPACGKKGRIDDAKIPDSGIFARCPGCQKRLWVNKIDGVSLAEEPSSSAPSQAGQPPASEPPPLPYPAPAQAAETTPTSQTENPASQPPVPSVPPVSAPDTAPAAPVQQNQPLTPADPVPGPAAGFEISPLPGAQTQPPPEEGHGIQCNLCGKVFPDTDMVRFGDTMVCAGCKPQYVQMMKSGVARTGTFSYGGFWIRFIAKIIDGLILAIAQSIFIVPLYIFLFKSVPKEPGPEMIATFMTANLFIQVISVAVGATYTTIFIGKYQATPGKMAFGLKVVAPDGGKITYWRALGRHFAEMVSAATLTIGYIMAGFDSQKRALHDRICTTRVIRK